MALLKVAKLGNPILRRQADTVSISEAQTPSFQRFLDDMVDTMRKEDGVGLAAPQVSQSKQVIVIESDENARYPQAPQLSLIVMLNPTITTHSEEMAEGWEGCLSLDNLRGKVARWTRIRVAGFNRFMEPLAIDAQGFLAVVFQHEIDHLHGKLFIDRMGDLSTLTHLAEYDHYWVNPPDEATGNDPTSL